MLAQKNLQPPFDQSWVDKLMDHKNDLLKDQVMKNHIDNLVSVLQNDMELKCQESDILHAFGVLRINSFEIDTLSGGHGRGLFPLLGGFIFCNFLST